MAFMLIYPTVAVLTLFVLVVIILMLRFGGKLCRLRHTAFADQDDWNNEEVYEHKVSYA